MKAKCVCKGPHEPCCICGGDAHFSVDWMVPSREPDVRPACSSRCAVRASVIRREVREKNAMLESRRAGNWNK